MAQGASLISPFQTPDVDQQYLPEVTPVNLVDQMREPGHGLLALSRRLMVELTTRCQLGAAAATSGVVQFE